MRIVRGRLGSAMLRGGRGLIPRRPLAGRGFPVGFVFRLIWPDRSWRLLGLVVPGRFFRGRGLARWVRVSLGCRLRLYLVGRGGRIKGSAFYRRRNACPSINFLNRGRSEFLPSHFLDGLDAGAFAAGMILHVAQSRRREYNARFLRRKTSRLWRAVRAAPLFLRILGILGQFVHQRRGGLRRLDLFLE